MNKSIIALFIALIQQAYGSQFNLVGNAGQAYSIEVRVGHPGQKLNVLVDTGSTTLAIAAYSSFEDDLYFHVENSSSLHDTGKQVQARYSQGRWVGKLVSDFVQFPSLPIVPFPSLPVVPEVRTDLALITESHNFFMNGSNWQGLLGLAYLPVGAWGENVVVESWLDSLKRVLNKQMSFQLKLCGVIGDTNATHYGNFELLDDEMPRRNPNMTYITPILRKRWYEVGVISVRVLTPESKMSENSTKNINAEDTLTDEVYRQSVCKELNREKSIVDSGTTNIRLPDAQFMAVVDKLRNAAQVSNVLILDEFWYHGEAACWPEPQKWSLPWLAIDLLNYDAENQYFTLEIPPQNFMRIVSVRNETGSVAEYCYKLGLEAGGKETVLGYTAMEGLQVLFNRSAGWIGWQTSNCGANTKITGPYNASVNLVATCQLTLVPDVDTSIKAAQWALCVLSIIAASVMIYLLAPCVKSMFVRRLTMSQQISLSEAALVGQETT